MDKVEPVFIEFLDLSGVEEQERNWVLSSLQTHNRNIQFPWRTPRYTHDQHDFNIPYKQCSNVSTTYNASPNVVLTANFNMNETSRTNLQSPIFPQKYQMTTAYSPYVAQAQSLPQPLSTSVVLGPMYSPQFNQTPNNSAHQCTSKSSVCLGTSYSQQIPETSPNVLTTFVVNSNINYAVDSDKSKAYINTKLEITQGFTNSTTQSVSAATTNTVQTTEHGHVTPDDKNQYTKMHSAPDVVLVVENNAENMQNEHFPTVAEINSLINAESHQIPKAVSPSTSDLHINTRESKKLSSEEKDSLVCTENVLSAENASPSAKSWASLFNKSTSAVQIEPVPNHDNSITKPLALVTPFTSNSASAEHPPSPDNSHILKEPFKSNYDDPNLHRMGEYLVNHGVDNRIISLQPRGLINRSNYCYINSILQALLACPPAYNLFNGLAQNYNAATEKKKITPVIDSMIKLVQQFDQLPAGMRVSRRVDKNQKKDQSLSINCDTPLEPLWIHKMLSGMRSDTFVVEGRQEDAEEFLGCLLNGMNDEMLELIKMVEGTTLNVKENDQNGNLDGDKEWQVMGPKNKGSITRRTEFSRTPISDIFGGLLRSRVHRTGDQSTDNIQPFFTLQLNIEKVLTVREALEALVCKNQLEGVTSSRTNQEVEAWQQVTIAELPIVLVLHLKCFDYKLDGCSKILKALDFPVDLKIDTKLLSSKTNYSAKEKQYKLFAVVYHDGKEASKGHYITDAYHVGYASWLRYDDASVKPVQEEHVLKPAGTRVPYLLFYRRSDSIRNK